jgi:hypothetical protein
MLRRSSWRRGSFARGSLVNFSTWNDKNGNDRLETMVFIDSRVADHSTLIAGLSADCEPVWLDATQDGLEQMQAALAGSARPGVDPHPGARSPRRADDRFRGTHAREPRSHAAELAAIGRALGTTAMCRSTAAKSARGATAAPSCARWRKPAARMSRLLRRRWVMPTSGEPGGSMSASFAPRR